MGRPALPVEVQRLFWSRTRDGEILDDAARLVGVSKSVPLRWFREAGGVMPDARGLLPSRRCGCRSRNGKRSAVAALPTHGSAPAVIAGTMAKSR